MLVLEMEKYSFNFRSVRWYIYKLKMLNISESARFLVGFPKTLNLPSFKLILVISSAFGTPSLSAKEFWSAFKRFSCYRVFAAVPATAARSGQFLPVILRDLLASGIYPSEVFDQLNVGDLSSASEHQVLARLDLLAASWQDSQVRLRWSPVVTPAAYIQNSDNWALRRNSKYVFVKLFFFSVMLTLLLLIVADFIHSVVYPVPVSLWAMSEVRNPIRLLSDMTWLRRHFEDFRRYAHTQTVRRGKLVPMISSQSDQPTNQS